MAQVGDASVSHFSKGPPDGNSLIPVDGGDGCGDSLGEKDFLPAEKVRDHGIFRDIQGSEIGISPSHESCGKCWETKALPPWIQECLQNGKQIGSLLGGHDIITARPDRRDISALECLFHGGSLRIIAHKNGEVPRKHILGILLVTGVDDLRSGVEQKDNFRRHIFRDLAVCSMVVEFITFSGNDDINPGRRGLARDAQHNIVGKPRACRHKGKVFLEQGFLPAEKCIDGLNQGFRSPESLGQDEKVYVWTVACRQIGIHIRTAKRVDGLLRISDQ